MAGNVVTVKRTGSFAPGLFTQELVGRLRETVKNHAELIEAHIRRSLGGTRHGEIGTSFEGLKYVMSAPGEPPAIDTGQLLNSIAIRYGMAGMEAEIGSFDIPYAAALEEGIGMEARPFVLPAYEAYRDEFVRAIQRDVAMTLQ